MMQPLPQKDYHAPQKNFYDLSYVIKITIFYIRVMFITNNLNVCYH